MPAMPVVQGSIGPRGPMRTSTVRSPAGDLLQTPLFVPSFSSRGFAVDEKGQSEVARALELAAPMTPEAFLVSAFDLHYGLIPGLDGLREYPAEGLLGGPALLFLDSGAYETREAYDLAEVYKAPPSTKEWNEELLEDCLSKIDPNTSVALVNLDERGDPEAQLDRATELFARHPTFMKDFLLKPHSDTADYIHVERFTPYFSEFSKFDMIGVTEKELGNKMLDRLRSLARLRQGLDDADVSAPIHVFGSLDPLISPLYYIAGAEIFDGLSWLRYAYHEGVAIYGDALGLLNTDGPDLRAVADTRRALMLANNLTELRRLSDVLANLQSSHGPDFSLLGRRADLYETAYRAIVRGTG